MGSFYNRMCKNALRLLKKRGLPVTLRRTDKGLYDPESGTRTSTLITDYDCVGTITNIDSAAANQFYSTGSLKESMIQKEDRMVILSSLKSDGTPLGFLPDPLTDSLLIDSLEYAVIASIPLAPGGLPVLFSIQVRR